MKIVISKDFIVVRSWGALHMETVANKDTTKMKFFILKLICKRSNDELDTKGRFMQIERSFKQLSFIFTRFFAYKKWPSLSTAFEIAQFVHTRDISTCRQTSRIWFFFLSIGRGCFRSEFKVLHSKYPSKSLRFDSLLKIL